MLKNLVEKINVVQQGKEGQLIIVDKEGTVIISKD